MSIDEIVSRTKELVEIEGTSVSMFQSCAKAWMEFKDEYTGARRPCLSDSSPTIEV